METVASIRSLTLKIQTATSYESIFGVLPSARFEVQKAGLTAAFRDLAIKVHPDKILNLPAATRTEAEEAFKRLVTLAKEAEAALAAGTYSAPQALLHTLAAAPFEIQSTLSRYQLAAEPLATGDFSIIYQGQSQAGIEVVLKVASVPTHNPWLEHEVEVLERFRTTPELAQVARFVPEVLDTFLISDGRRRVRATVFDRLKDCVSITDLIKAFPGGMPPADAAWVCRRLLGQVGAAALLGVVHGALVPDHLLVGVTTHDPCHIGWTHAVAAPGQITHVIERWRALYPPEVFTREPADTRADIYMAGKTMIKLLGGDPETNQMPNQVPPAMAAVIHRCVQPAPERRYQSGNQALDDLSRVARELWGKTYRPLVLPTRS